MPRRVLINEEILQDTADAIREIEDSTNVLSGGGTIKPSQFASILNDVGSYIDDINGEVAVQKLSYLDGTKTAIKQALIDKGQEVTDNDTFRSYASKIAGISGDDTYLFQNNLISSVYSHKSASFAIPDGYYFYNVYSRGTNSSYIGVKSISGTTSGNNVNVEVYCLQDGTMNSGSVLITLVFKKL